MPYLPSWEDNGFPDWSSRGTSPRSPPPTASQSDAKDVSSSNTFVLDDGDDKDSLTSSSSSDDLRTSGPLRKATHRSEDEFRPRFGPESSTTVTPEESSGIATPADGSSDYSSHAYVPRKGIPAKRGRKRGIAYKQKLQMRYVKVDPRIFPESLFSPAPAGSDRQDAAALTAILNSDFLFNNCSYDDEKFTSVDLIDFCIYENPRVRESRALVYDLPEFFTLQEWYERRDNAPFFFDGTLVIGDEKHHVRHVPSMNVSIGNLCYADKPSVGNDLWLASLRGRSQNVWYRLKKPEPSYSRFFEPFRWNADLCKHAIDFLHLYRDEEVRLWHFTSTFFKHMNGRHKESPEFAAWLDQYGSTDFRRALAAYPAFFKSQAHGVGYGDSRLWNDILGDSLQNHAPKSNSQVPKTVVTPYVYSCFQNTWFSKILRPKQPKVLSTHLDLWREAFGGQTPYTTRQFDAAQLHSGRALGVVEVGDVVAVPPDDATSSNWRADKAEAWYFLVCRITHYKTVRVLEGLWLYDSSQTLMANTRYTYQNELFLSNHCNCYSGRDAALIESEILWIEPVRFYCDLLGIHHCKTKFVRQAWDCNEHAFVTLRPDHFRCQHHELPRERYEAGRTVLVNGSSSLLEPVILMEPAIDRTRVQVRRLVRKRSLFPPADLNELMLTDDYASIHTDDIEMPCIVRCFEPEEIIPRPYCSSGTGNTFFIRYGLRDGCIATIASDPGFDQGFDPREKAAFATSCLDLFCGSGNLGFGIDDSSAVVTTHAVDTDQFAIHTKMANHADPESCLFYWGSVDDFLQDALDGRFKNAPPPGQVGIITAGSPCQGFSKMNQHRDSPKSLKNVSMIASVMSFVDLYRPKHLVLENVLNMAETNSSTGQNALSYVLSCLVGMGYQTQQFNCDACTDGAPQNRSRIIVVATAPGLTLPSAPGRSHKFKDTHKNRALGKAANGLRFGGRILDAPKAFDMVSIAGATAHLPHNPDGRVSSVAYPDHVVPRSGFYLRALLQNIPRIPGANATLGLQQSHTPESVRLCHAPNSMERGWKNTRSCQRLDGEGLTPTIIASYSPEDSRVGQLIHWTEDRSLTIEEARIAQQFPSDFVLLGDGVKRWKLVGNAVPRGLAQALGLSLRHALETDWKKAAVEPKQSSYVFSDSVLAASTDNIQPCATTTLQDRRAEAVLRSSMKDPNKIHCSRVSHKRKRTSISMEGVTIVEDESEREETVWRERVTARPRPSMRNDNFHMPSEDRSTMSVDQGCMREITRRQDVTEDFAIESQQPSRQAAKYFEETESNEITELFIPDGSKGSDNVSEVIFVSSKRWGSPKW